MTYFTTEEDSGDALRTFMKPTDEMNWNTGLYQFKGMLYRTKSLDPASSISIDEEELRILIDNFELIYGGEPEATNLLEIEKLRSLLSDLKEVTEKEDRNTIVRENFPISRLGKAIVRFANDLCQFVCTTCHKLYFEREVLLNRRYNHFQCPRCRRTLQVTPIWVLKAESQANPTTPLTVWTSGIDHGALWDAWKGKYYAKCPKCGSGTLNGYYSRDAARLMESSRITCTSCNHEFRLFSQNYSLTAPSENLTESIIASTYNRSTLQFRKEDILNRLKDASVFDDSLVRNFWFSPAAKIKEILLGYWYGANIRKLYQAKRFGLELSTGCLYMQLNESYFEKVVSFLREAYSEHPDYGPRLQGTTADSGDLHKLVLHSMAHAILSHLPIISGMSIDSFSYLYDLPSNSLLVYERAPGGIGACAELSKLEEEHNEPVAVEFFEKLKDAMVKCTCDDRCKYCLAIQGCGEWNRALSRFALGPLLRVQDAEAMTWGF